MYTFLLFYLIYCANRLQWIIIAPVQINGIADLGQFLPVEITDYTSRVFFVYACKRKLLLKILAEFELHHHSSIFVCMEYCKYLIFISVGNPITIFSAATAVFCVISVNNTYIVRQFQNIHFILIRNVQTETMWQPIGRSTTFVESFRKVYEWHISVL